MRRKISIVLLVFLIQPIFKIDNRAQREMQETIIHQSIILYCGTGEAFRYFTNNELLQSWLTELADVEPKVGGKYELFWNPEVKENNSTIGCKVTAFEKDKLISFEWRGPVQFKDFMNAADPLTHVVVFFIPINSEKPQTEIHLIHSGWRKTGEWEEARLFFIKAWDLALSRLTVMVDNY
ncbi:SRPBCC domain-containing protein [Bacteroidota bacterium]